MSQYPAIISQQKTTNSNMEQQRMIPSSELEKLKLRKMKMKRVGGGYIVLQGTNLEERMDF